MKQLKERDVQRAIQDWLAAKRIFHRKVNTSGIYKQSTGSYIPSQSKGMPDIVAVIGGRFVGIEVKAAKGVQSDEQKLFEIDLVRAGGIYILAKSIDDVERGLAAMPKPPAGGGG